jgi:hypothetical protein
LIKIKYIPGPVGVNKTVAQEIEGSLYPNPSSGEFTLSSSQHIVSSVALYNVLGEKVMDKNAIRSNEVKLDVSQLPSGIYFVKIFTEKGVLTKKLMKE